MIDRALLPLSIVRFGFRQWITLAGLPPQQQQGQEQEQQQQPQPQLPISRPLVSSASMDFLQASASLSHTPQPPSPPTATHPQQRQQQHPTFLLRFTTCISSQRLLIQPSARILKFLRPLTLTDTKPRESATLDGPTVRLAPYGILACLLGAPSGASAENETEAMAGWTQAFGYPDGLMHVEGGSQMVWIRLLEGNPMLYPRRLVLIDEDEKKEPEAIVTVAEATAMAEEEAVRHVDAIERDAPVKDEENKSEGEAMAVDTKEEGEEGEELSEEGEFDEEGEIADPVTITTTTTSVIAPQPRPPPGPLSTELDAIISRL
ncbi:hypothetical protein GGF37_007594, partial [Kickxella alabastrina]